MPQAPPDAHDGRHGSVPAATHVVTPEPEMSAQPSSSHTATAAGAGRPPLQRPREGRILAGVAAGLADHLGWDVALVRLLIVVATLLTQGLGLLAYLVAVLVIPAAEPGAPRPAARRAGEQVGGRPAAFWFGVALVVVGGWWLLAATPVRLGLLPGVSLGALAPPLLLIALGLALWVTGDRTAVGDARSRAAPPPSASWPSAPQAPFASSPPPTPPVSSPPSASSSSPAAVRAPATASVSPPPATVTPSRETPMMTTSQQPSTEPVASPDLTGAQGPDGSGAAPGATPPGPPSPPPTASGGDGWTPPPAPERQDSVLSRVTIGVLLVIVGLLWTLRLAGAVTIATGQIIAAALLVVGVGLLVGAVRGRGRGLIWLGVILLPFVLLAQVPSGGWMSGVPVFTTDGAAVGELRLTPTEIDEVQPRYELGAGSMRLDLTELPFDGEELALELAVGVGQIQVIVPDDVDVTAEGSVGIGEVQLFERSAGGLGVGDVRVTVDTEDPRGTVDLDLSAGLGEIRLERAPARIGGTP